MLSCHIKLETISGGISNKVHVKLADWNVSLHVAHVNLFTIYYDYNNRRAQHLTNNEHSFNLCIKHTSVR